MACRICNYSEFACFLAVAQVLFNDFVKDFTDLFSIKNTTWKIHAVTHMVDEVKRHGIFREFSTYDFESFMNTIKKTLHNHSLPLQQLHRRLLEIHKSETVFFHTKTKIKFDLEKL